jgi:hypothetical protein
MMAALFSTASAVCLLGCPPGPTRTYDVQIERNFATLEEEVLIQIAEASHPAREDVAAVYPAGTKPEDLPEHVWWYYKEFGSSLRLPYAITADAIEYYKQLVLGHQAYYLQHRASLSPEGGEQFYYIANIHFFANFEDEHGETYSNVYVVSMALGWNYSSGPDTGAGFDQDRAVVLTPSGEVLHVQGDGRARVFVS